MLQRRFIHFFLAVVFAVLLSVVLPTVARADEAPPPETPTTNIIGDDVQPTNGGEAVTDDQNPSTQIPDESTPDDDAAAPDEQGAPPPESPLAATTGQPAAAPTIVANPGDSFWCPAGQPAVPGEGGCTAAFGSFTELLGFLLANETDPLYQQAGVIYVAIGDYSGGETEINFNAFRFINLSQYDLALQGGWNPDAASIGPDDRTTFTIPVTIGVEDNPWRGALVVSNINIHGVAQQTALTLVSQSDVTVVNVQLTENNAGLAVVAGGDVVLENVEANDNRSAGATIVADEDVSVADSTFNDNGAILPNRTVVGYGVYIVNDGDVSLRNVQADRNFLYGARIRTDGDLFIGQGDFSDNRAYTSSCWSGYAVYGYGLRVEKAANVTLIGVAANRNYLYGASIQSNGWVLITDSSFSANRFDRSSQKQVGYGLNVVSGSYVTLSGVRANDNSLYGAIIQAAGDVAVSTSEFSGHRLYSCSNNYECGGGCTPYGYGLKVVAGGNIYLYQVTADRNALYGASLKANGDVFVYDGSFSQNAFSANKTRVGYGLEIISGGTVGLTDVRADGNNLYGARVQAVGDVSVFGSSFSGNQAYSGSSCSGYTAYGYGLQVTTSGSIHLDGVQANQNHLYGASLKAGANVSVNNSSFSANAFGRSNTLQVGYGIKIVSGGAVSLAGVQADDNRLFGADIQGVGDVSIAAASFSGNDLYTCSSNYECGGCTPYGYGLKVVTSGDVYLYAVTADANVLYGAYLKTSGNVYITSSSFSNNVYASGNVRDGYGLQVISGAQVWMWGVQANGNHLYGAKVQAIGDVTIDASSFSDNRAYRCSYCGSYTVYGYGLQVSSKGSIRLTGVLADGNHLYGASLKADGDILVADSDFSNNRFDLSNKIEVGYGLNAVSGGNATLVHVTAYDNSLYGAYIQAAGDVTIEDSAFAGHLFYKCTYCGGCTGGYGLQVIAGGTITLNDVSAEDNALYGARLAAGEDIVVLGGVYSNNARDYGLSATASGAVHLTSLIAFGNGSSGVVISTPGAVTVTYGLYKNNAQTGLSIVTSSDVVLNGLTAWANGSHGVSVRGNCCISVYLTDGVYVENGGYGLKVVNGALFQSGSPVFNNNTLGNLFVDGGLCNPRPPSNGKHSRNCRR